ncbi:MAG: DtxR family Mn-dependent transcriptional regulator [Salibacteraceae bacterium]|jgi:DtxR family Mn-dependent transcriptional regulator
MLSFTEENYLKTIFSLIENNKGTASTNEIAEKIQTKAPTVTDMLKRLSTKKLIIYKPYQGVFFTDEGLSIALNLVRKHRIWETFLVKKLGFGWGEVHDIAEELEHVKSVELINKLEEFLGFPKFDPHGDPIPDSEGRLEFHKDVTISNLGLNHFGLIVGLKDTSSDFLNYLVKSGLTLGQSVGIKDINDFDQSIDIIVGSSNNLTVSNTVAQNIFIKKLSR